MYTINMFHTHNIGSIEKLISEIYEYKGSHISGLWMLIDINIIMRIFAKSLHTN